MDKLDRLRCLSRATISSCAGSEPWESKFLESFDYDSSGNRTNRRSGAFNTADDDAYTYVSGPTDIIDRVTSGGTAKEMSNTFKGELSSVNDPNLIQFTFDYDSRVTATEDAFLGSVAHYNTPMGDRYAKKSPCNARMTYFRYRPDAETGTSPFINFLDAYGTCADEYPREQRTYVYLEGRPIAIAHATLASSGASAPTAGATYWLHSDHLGTPVLVTNASRVERWRWENDPFGRSKPVEYTVSSQDMSPDDDGSSGSPSVYKTCCCTTCGVSGCGLGTASCAAGCCAGASSQAVVWTKTYAPSGANNVRLHFSQFNVAPGATRTSKDYVRLENGASTVVGTLTGDLGDFWGPWSGDGTQVLKLYADNTADGTRGVVVDQLEYTTSTNGRYVMHLRMPGQLWDEEVQHAYNFHRWYRAEDGRYVSPDPIGLAGGEAGYFGYVGGNPLKDTDPSGLLRRSTNDSDATANRAEDDSQVVAQRRRQQAQAEALPLGCHDVEAQPAPGDQTCENGVAPVSAERPFAACTELLGSAGGTKVFGYCERTNLVCRICGCETLARYARLAPSCYDGGRRVQCAGQLGLSITILRLLGVQADTEGYRCVARRGRDCRRWVLDFDDIDLHIEYEVPCT
jgi:RHS repeat-associated protein